MAKRYDQTRRMSLARCATMLGSIAGFAVFSGRVALASTRLERTPSQTEGPYYPVSKPSRADTNLVHGRNGEVAEGVLLRLSGQVLAQDGSPVPGAAVEIWQCDNRAIYRHPRAPGQGSGDPHFAGYGETVTLENGRYDFLTIVPVAYPGRPPHIHVKVNASPRDSLTTQLYVADRASGRKAGLLSSLFSSQPDALTMTLEQGPPAAGRSTMVARFNLVV